MIFEFSKPFLTLSKISSRLIKKKIKSQQNTPIHFFVTSLLKSFLHCFSNENDLELLTLITSLIFKFICLKENKYLIISKFILVNENEKKIIEIISLLKQELKNNMQTIEILALKSENNLIDYFNQLILLIESNQSEKKLFQAFFKNMRLIQEVKNFLNKFNILIRFHKNVIFSETFVEIMKRVFELIAFYGEDNPENQL